MKTSHADAG